MTLMEVSCAAVEMPPNVALSKYDDNYSASRAAIMEWKHTLLIKRKKFADQFWKPIYELWFTVMVLQNRIQAPGFLAARENKNYFVVLAYLNARFAGPNVPHIDPVKEVTAERLKLGVTSAAIPLTTVEAATEALGDGDSVSNMVQYADELEESKKLGIEMPEPELPPASGGSNKNED